MSNIKHSKIRNTGLLYEFLLRQVTADVLNKSADSNAVKLLKKRFNERTELGKEFALYNLLVNKRFKGDKQASFFIDEVLKARKDLNHSQLRKEKYNLVKDLKENYNLNKFLSSKVKNYKLYASIYKLFEAIKLSPEEKTETYFTLIENITTTKETISLSKTIGGANLPKDEDLRILTYRTLLEKFNSKYSKLNYPQKSLLRAYINNVSGTNSLKEFIQKVRPSLKLELKKYSKNVTDKVVKIKLKEAINVLDEFCKTSIKSKSVKDKAVLQTMRYMELLKELKKSGKKSNKRRL